MSVRDRWINRFIERHYNELKNIFLNNINYARRVTDNSRYFKYYFERVSVYSYVYYF